MMGSSQASYVLYLILVLLITSCGVDNAEIEQQIVGNWILEQRDTSQCADDEENGSEGFICSSLFCSRLIFSDSSTYVIEITTEGSTSAENGTFRIDGSQLQLCNDPDEDESLTCQDFAMTLTGSTLVINAQEKEDGCFVRRRYVRN